jgi:RNA polymerase primary sigma factor
MSSLAHEGLTDAIVAELAAAEGELREALACALGPDADGLADVDRRALSGALAELERAGASRGGADADLAAARAAHARMARARAELLRANLHIVTTVARRYARRGLDLADLVQEGHIGLMQAIDRFDPERQVKFATYAVWWIRQSIAKAIGEQARTIRVPPHVTAAVSQLYATRHELIGRLGRMPGPSEIAGRLSKPLEAVQRMLALPRAVSTLDAPSDPQPVATDRMDLPAPPSEAADAERTLALTRGALAALTERERAVVMLRFGIDRERPLSLRDAARTLALSRDHLRRVELRALRKLARDEGLRALR